MKFKNLAIDNRNNQKPITFNKENELEELTQVRNPYTFTENGKTYTF